MEKTVKRIWITTDWEPNPLQKGDNRLGRANRLAVYLARRGYEATEWFTTYEHPTKKHIESKTTIHDLEPNLRIVALHCPIPYKRNVSPVRFIHLDLLAAEMRKFIRDEKRFPPPDIILCAWPPEQYCRAALRYGKQHGIPVIVDARDMWPDIFDRAFPKWMQPAARILLAPMKRQAAITFQKAAAICGMSSAALDWALQYAGRESTSLDRCIYIGNERTELASGILERELSSWARIGVSSNTWNMCMFTSLGRGLDMEALFCAVEKVYSVCPRIRLVIGGKGDGEACYRQLAEKRPYIKMMGWMNQEQMISLMTISAVGIMNYPNTVDMKDAFGNKISQFFSYGLPLIASMQGVAKQYVEKYDCGMIYEEGNAQQLSELLLMLINNPKMRDRMSKNAYERFKTDFDAQVVHRQFENMIQDVCTANDAKTTPK